MVTLTKMQARQLARRYAVEQMRSQDMPHWAYDNGLDGDDHEGGEEFMAELARIADRIEKTI